MTASLLLSALVRKFRGAGCEALRQGHPHDWLVWEPGAWKPPAKDGSTLAVIRIPTPSPSQGEALAIALVPRGPRGAQLTVGRGSANDIEINDATLSQLHLLLMQGDGGEWTVRDAGSKNGTWLDGVPLQPGVPLALRDGARIQAAHVCLTYYKPEGLYRRIESWDKPTPLALGRS
jgi:hypothetical protein